MVAPACHSEEIRCVTRHHKTTDQVLILKVWSSDVCGVRDELIITTKVQMRCDIWIRTISLSRMALKSIIVLMFFVVMLCGWWPTEETTPLLLGPLCSSRSCTCCLSSQSGLYPRICPLLVDLACTKAATSSTSSVFFLLNRRSFLHNPFKALILITTLCLCAKRERYSLLLKPILRHTLNFKHKAHSYAFIAHSQNLFILTLFPRCMGKSIALLSQLFFFNCKIKRTKRKYLPPQIFFLSMTLMLFSAVSLHPHKQIMFWNLKKAFSTSHMVTNRQAEHRANRLTGSQDAAL